MVNSRRVALTMRHHLQSSARRVGSAYELGQLGNRPRSFDSDFENNSRHLRLANWPIYGSSLYLDRNYDYSAHRPLEDGK